MRWLWPKRGRKMSITLEGGRYSKNPVVFLEVKVY